MRRRRVKVGDRVSHDVFGVGDVIRADGAAVSVSFDITGLPGFEDFVYRVRSHVAPQFLVIVDGGAS